MINLFLALVVEGYSDTLAENEAVISPSSLEEFIEKWSEYDPQGTGFLTPEDLAFFLFEVNPPLGLKEENEEELKETLNCKTKKEVFFIKKLINYIKIN